MAGGPGRATARSPSASSSTATVLPGACTAAAAAAAAAPTPWRTSMLCLQSSAASALPLPVFMLPAPAPYVAAFRAATGVPSARSRILQSTHQKFRIPDLSNYCWKNAAPIHCCSAMVFRSRLLVQGRPQSARVVIRAVGLAGLEWRKHGRPSKPGIPRLSSRRSPYGVPQQYPHTAPVATARSRTARRSTASASRCGCRYTTSAIDACFRSTCLHASARG